ncbi:30S ribosomal protein S1 [Geobacter sp. AOG1]|uniref:30S ribosomal protein S1 n=1 Tax=Geobacter sp. AOG1 TaxID=1566346 RepID=UPI001CC67104|nr:30S ribosomal protein S1 [Geobacter sp. AOG1]GFE57155.1 30S ribosomal protein S1 [Geobacter sp. AOG1]
MTDNDKPVNEENNGEENFADLLAQSFAATPRLAPGDKVEAKVLKISGEWIFLDTGRKGEGVLERKELLDAEGNLTVREGDTVTAWFLSSHHNEMRFTTKVGGGVAGNAQLEDAWRSGIPVEGRVEKEIKGGFEVKLGTVRAFCPYSQMGLKRVADAAVYVGQHLSFRITEYGEKGRNIVLSHRAVLEELQHQEKERLKAALQVDQTVTGTVTSLRDFGAFVDIGGVEGLIPMAEVGWGRVTDIRDALSVGQQVQVVIKQLDWDKDRISLSLRETLADPWEKAVMSYPEGSFHTGRVARLAQFGAFVTLGEGIDGLIHISRLGAGKRINHPREVLKEGEEVEVKVESVDRDNRRISLALAGVARAADEEEATLASFRKSAEESSAQSLGSLGELLKAKLEKGKN